MTTLRTVLTTAVLAGALAAPPPPSRAPSGLSAHYLPTLRPPAASLVAIHGGDAHAFLHTGERLHRGQSLMRVLRRWPAAFGDPAAVHVPERRCQRLRLQGRGRPRGQRQADPLPARRLPEGPGAADLNHDDRFTGTVYAFCEGGRFAIPCTAPAAATWVPRMTTSATLDRERLAASTAPSASASPPSTRARASCSSGPGGSLRQRRADDLDGQVGRRPPAVPRRRARGHASSDVDGHSLRRLLPRRHRRDGRATRRPATVAAVRAPVATQGGATLMLPTEDAALGRRGARRGASALPLWSFALTATDANRWALRLVPRDHRTAEGRCVFSYCYHGSVDETFVALDADGRPASPRGQRRRRPSTRPQTTRVVRVQRPGRASSAAARRRATSRASSPSRR